MEAPGVADRKTIIVKNLPENVDEELITNYLEVVSKAEVTAFYFHPDVIGICLVQVDEELTDAAVCAIKEKCQIKPLSGKTLEIEQVEISSKILVSNVSSAHSKDLLELYFAKQAKLCGGGDVASVNALSDIGKAIVEFDNAEVSRKVQEKSHTLSGVQLETKQYIHGFDWPGIEKLKAVAIQPTPVPSADCRDSPSPTRPQEHHGASTRSPPPTLPKPVGNVKALQQAFEDAHRLSSGLPAQHSTTMTTQVNPNIGGCIQGEEPAQPESSFSEAKKTAKVVYGEHTFQDSVHVDSGQIPLSQTKTVPVYQPPTQVSFPPAGGRHLPGQTEVYPGTHDAALHQSRSEHIFGHPQDSGFPVSLELGVSSAHQGNTFQENSSLHTGTQSQMLHDEVFETGHHSTADPCDIHLSVLSTKHPEESRPYERERIVGQAPPSDANLQQPISIGHSTPVSQESSVPRETISKESFVPRETTTSEQPKSKLELLKLSGFENSNAIPNCEISIEVDKGFIQFTGDDDSISKAQVLMYESIQKMSEVRIKLAHATMANLLSTSQAKEDVKMALNCDKVVTYVEKNNNFVILALSDKQANTCRASLNKILLSEKITLKPGHLKFLGTREWQSFVSECHSSDQLVRIVTDEKKNAIWINGLNGDVSIARRSVEQKLKENATMEKKILFSGIKGRFIYKHFRHEVTKINEKFRPKGVSVLMPAPSKDSVELIVNGAVHEIDEAIKEVKALDTKLREIDVQIPYKMSRSAPWHKFSSTKPKFSDWINNLEEKYNCCIQSNILPRKFTKPPSSNFSKGKKSSTPKRPRLHKYSRSRSTDDLDKESPSPPREASPPLPSGPTSTKFGNTTVTVKSGDITKEQADVLVNIIHTSLDLKRGGLSKNFLKAGTDTLQQSLSNTGTASSTLGAVIATPGGGNLKCKQVCHAVLGDYKNENSMQELKSSIQDILQTSSKTSSLSLPSMGCGNLKYPADRVAALILSELKQFLTTSATSLKDINIVVFDTKVLPVFQKEVQKLSGDTPRKPSYGERSRSRHGFGDVVETARRVSHWKRRSGEYDGPASRISQHGTETVTVGGTKIILKQGDITTEKANVLVNVTNTDLDLSRGVVSQKLLKKGGPELQEATQQSGKAKNGDVVMIKSCGELQAICGYIANVVLPRWRDSSTIKFLSQVVAGCLKECDKVSATSITFPSLGCGQLRYPTDKAARCMLDEIRKYIQTSATSLKTVTVVIFDSSLFESFSENLIQSNESGVTSDNISGSSDSDEDILDESEETSGAHYSPSGSGELSTPQEEFFTLRESHSGDGFHLVTWTDNVGKTQNGIKKDLDNLFSQQTFDIGTLVEGDDKREKILKLLREPVKNIVEKHNVELTDAKTRKLKLYGDDGDMFRAVQEITTIVMDKMKKLENPVYVLKHFGDFNDYCEMKIREKCPVPSYWSDDVKGVKETVVSFWRTLMGKSQNKFRRVKAPKSIYTAVENVVKKTWIQHLVGHGADAKGIQPGSKMKINNIEIVENLELYDKYCHRRQQCFHQVMQNQIKPLTKLPVKSPPANPVMTEAHLSSELKMNLESEVNEFFVFHGTRADCVDTICSVGFDFRQGENGMLGRGVYATESSTKGDQYPDRPNRDTHGKGLHMILMRVTMGQMYACDDVQPPKFTRPPCTGKGCHKHNCNSHHDFFDSIVFQSTKLFREFVVYSNDQCYPEFLISYDRV